MKKIRQELITLAMTLLLAGNASAEWTRVSGTAMTTPIELEFWSEDPAGAEQIGEDVLEEFRRIDRQMSRYREDSELSKLNASAAEGPVKVSESLYQVLNKAKEISEFSEGAFDISFGSVGYLYDYRQKKQPSGEDIASRLASIDYRDIVLDPEARTVAFRKPGLLLDLGGIAKGYAVDRGIAILAREGVRHARLSAGGDMRLIGDKRGRPWMVGIRDPRSESRNAVVLPLSDVAISTSGDYERFFIDEEGDRIHHILSPSTGKPAEGVQSVTILGDDALTTDGLSTAVFVLGAARGLDLVNRLEGIDAIIIDSERRMHYSDGLMPPQ